MAVSGSLRLPPPVGIADKDPLFNRWLLEVLSVLSAAGGIDPTQIVGWNELVASVATNASNVLALENNFLALQNLFTTQQAQVVALQQQAQVFSGTGAPAGGLGKNTDWYYNLAGAVGARLYIKVAGAWAAQAI